MSDRAEKQKRLDDAYAAISKDYDGALLVNIPTSLLEEVVGAFSALSLEDADSMAPHYLYRQGQFAGVLAERKASIAAQIGPDLVREKER